MDSVLVSLTERLAAETGEAAPAGWRKSHSGWTLYREGEAADVRRGLAEGRGEPVLLAHVQRPDVDWANGKGWYWYVQDPDRKAKDWPSGHERHAWDAIAAAEEVVEQLGLEPIVKTNGAESRVDVVTPASAAREAFSSLRNTMASDPRDWGRYKRDAWAWGLVLGWEQPELKELANRHGWSASDVADLVRLHRSLQAQAERG